MFKEPLSPAATQKLREHLETFADAAALPSQHFIRCEPSKGGCGASFRKDLDACPICTWMPEERDE